MSDKLYLVLDRYQKDHNELVRLFHEEPELISHSLICCASSLDEVKQLIEDRLANNFREAGRSIWMYEMEVNKVTEFEINYALNLKEKK